MVTFLMRNSIVKIALAYLLCRGSAEEMSCDANGVCTSILCQDNTDQCDVWASQGECDANPRYMLKECQKSCFVCGNDNGDGLGDGSAFGVPQIMGNEAFNSTPEDAKERLRRVTRYMEHSGITPEIKTKCRNNHAECTNWAVSGECEGNPICKWRKQGLKRSSATMS